MYAKRLYLVFAVAGLTFVAVTPTIFASQVTPGLQSTATSVIDTVIALIIVLLLIGVLVRFLAKRANIQQRGAIQVVAARQLASNRSVQIVEVGSKRYLLGVGEDVTLLADVSDSYDSSGVIEESSLAESLSATLANLRQNRSGEGGKRR